jgi:ubiquitin-like-conjugating enzyme ATG10
MAFTLDEFNQCINDLYEQSKQIHDRWQLVKVSKGSYLIYSFVDQNCLKYDFHVVFSESYSVPVLYFNISHLDGSLLSLDEIWNLFKHKKNSNMYETITQQEHPILQRPFFVLHPCHTENLLRQVTDQSAKKRFLFWLSIYGQSIGLPLSINYAID